MSLGKRVMNRLRPAVSEAYLRGTETGRSILPGHPGKFTPKRIGSQAEFTEYRNQTQPERMRRMELESSLAQEKSPFRTSGYCFVCSRWTHFSSSWSFCNESEGGKQINWREHLVCRHCQLNNRTRAAIHLLADAGLLSRNQRVYATEQTTQLFAHLKSRFDALVGSEHLGESVPLGECNGAGVMNQDLTRLTFPENSFDLILSFEVLEHVPNFSQGFRECARVLRPGGKMLFSVPFNVNSTSNLIRARLLEDNSVEHLQTPEYHGDPINSEGCLCFQHFGWEMLEQVKQLGFSKISALLYYSRDYGYLGDGQIQFFAEK